MGASAHRSNSTAHNRNSDKNHRSRQTNTPPSPVSPLNSNGENWKFPPVKTPHKKAQATPSEIPLQNISNKKRLSRPFEQPYPMTSSNPHPTPTPTPKRKPIPPPLTIPPPAHHQSRRQRDQNPPNPENPALSSKRPSTRRHQGWDPLKEEQRNTDAHDKDKNKGRRADGGDLERQGKKKKKEKLSSEDKGAIAGIIVVVLMAVAAGVGFYYTH